jgi:hypothetical protein
MNSYQSSCPGRGDQARIVNGRFNLSVVGYGTVDVFLDMNRDGTYQRNEPDWRWTSSTVTPADFDAVREFRVNLVGIPPSAQVPLIHTVVCTNEDAVYGSPDGSQCGEVIPTGLPTTVYSAEGTFYPKTLSWAIWFAKTAMSPFDRSLPHFVGRWTAPTCALDGDFMICSLSFADLVNADAGPAAVSGADLAPDASAAR